jgi:hypothetical protein
LRKIATLNAFFTGVAQQSQWLAESNKSPPQFRRINVVRRMLGRTFIDPDRCARGLEALRQYRREWDDRLKDWKANPLHNFAENRCAQSLRCATLMRIHTLDNCHEHVLAVLA